ncbi:hypothetical protein KIW84_065597 [Lathyrus oleraceus]|uniref:Uncharacterized protein n=1 Tax=Pisum sativum TaxID=3888 RepID=A0A9D5AA11_PEA|nr:hypothetical protein KIW84_065597 [Pisum sativum]
MKLKLSNERLLLCQEYRWFIAAVAHTHVLQEGSVTGGAADVIAAANTAAEVALRLGKKNQDHRRRQAKAIPASTKFSQHDQSPNSGNTKFHIKERATKFRFSKSQEIISKHLSPCWMGAMISAMSTKQLPFPTGSFELIHGSRCQLLPRLHDNLCGADFKSSNLQHKGSYRPWKVMKFYCK